MSTNVQRNLQSDSTSTLMTQTRDMGEKCCIDVDLCLTHAFFIILGDLLNS